MKLTTQNGSAVYPHHKNVQGNGHLNTNKNLNLLPNNTNGQMWLTEVEALEDQGETSRLELAILRERNRLARELHDNVAQSLGYLNLQISSLNSLLANGQLVQAQANLRELKQIVKETYTDVRGEIFNLRGNVSSGSDFWDTLQKCIAKYKKFYDLSIQLVTEIECAQLEFPTEIGRQLIHIIQEALINAHKHAGVDKALIHFSRKKGHICIVIEDNGNGFNLDQIDQMDQASFGLQIMYERAASIGGSLEINSTPDGGGTQVVITL